MQFVVPVSVELCPPHPFVDVLESTERLRSYGWKYVDLDSGPPGALTACVTRTITYTLQGKEGATKEMAEKDVRDALTGVGTGVKWLAGLSDKVTEGLTGGAALAGSAAGSGVSGFGKAVGLGGGVGALLAGGAFTILLVGVAVAVLVVAVKKA